MQKLLSVTGLLCGAIFALQTEASEQQQKTVDVYAKLIEVPFIGQTGMVIPGASQSGYHFKIPVQEGLYPTLCRRQTYKDITDYLERVYPDSEAMAFNAEGHDAYFADVFLDLKLPIETQLRKTQTREFAYLLTLAAIYQAIKKQANVNPKKA